MQAVEQFPVAGKPAAIQQRNGELDVLGIEAVTLSQGAAGRAEFDSYVPQLLRERPDGVLEPGTGVQKHQVYVRKRKEPLAPVATGGAQRETGPAGLGRKVFLPQTKHDLVQQQRALGNGSRAIAGRSELPTDARRLLH